jgi:hypothetical protein
VEQGIWLRTGCFCNPGTGEAAEGITDGDVAFDIESCRVIRDGS